MLSPFTLFSFSETGNKQFGHVTNIDDKVHKDSYQTSIKNQIRFRINSSPGTNKDSENGIENQNEMQVLPQDEDRENMNDKSKSVEALPKFTKEGKDAANTDENYKVRKRLWGKGRVLGGGYKIGKRHNNPEGQWSQKKNEDTLNSRSVPSLDPTSASAFPRVYSDDSLALGDKAQFKDNHWNSPTTESFSKSLFHTDVPKASLQAGPNAKIDYTSFSQDPYATPHHPDSAKAYLSNQNVYSPHSFGSDYTNNHFDSNPNFGSDTKSHNSALHQNHHPYDYNYDYFDNSAQELINPEAGFQSDLSSGLDTGHNSQSSDLYNKESVPIPQQDFYHQNSFYNQGSPEHFNHGSPEHFDNGTPENFNHGSPEHFNQPVDYHVNQDLHHVHNMLYRDSPYVQPYSEAAFRESPISYDTFHHTLADPSKIGYPPYVLPPPEVSVGEKIDFLLEEVQKLVRSSVNLFTIREEDLEETEEGKEESEKEAGKEITVEEALESITNCVQSMEELGKK